MLHFVTGGNLDIINLVWVNEMTGRRMKKAAIFFVGFGIVVALATFLPRERKIVISDFSWSVSGKTAAYSFSIANQTEEKLSVVVVVEAQRVSEGKDGAKLHPFGLTTVELSLAAREARKTEGMIELLDFGSSATRVSYHASLK